MLLLLKFLYVLFQVKYFVRNLLFIWQTIYNWVSSLLQTGLYG